MKIVTTTSVYPNDVDIFESVDRLAEIGFEALDMAFDYCGEASGEDEAWAHRLREHADRRGVRFTHSHAYFDAPDRTPEVERDLRCAEILGISYMVVHPAFRDAEGRIYEDPEEFLAVNTAAFRELLPAAERHHIVLLAENLLWGASIPPAVLSELVERVDSPYFGWCCDIGHAHRKGLRPSALLGLKHPPLSLHIHDNHANHDEHLLPGDGTLDWKEFLDTLHAIGYAGEFVLEAHHQSMEAPDEQRDAILRELLARAEKMVAYLKEQ